VELSDGRSGGGIAMEIPVGDEESFSSPTTLPKRLRRRLRGAECKSPSTVEEIEAKLRDADLRRQVSLLYIFFRSETVCLFGLVRKFRVLKLNLEMVFTFLFDGLFFFCPLLIFFLPLAYFNHV